MRELDRHRALTDGAGDSLHRLVAHVAGREDTWQARLEQERVAVEVPSQLRADVRTGQDEAALAGALEKRTIAGAGLDVFEREPQVHPLLLKLENIVLAPHIASASVDTRRQMSLMAAENAVAALEGRRPPNLLNPELWDAMRSAG